MTENSKTALCFSGQGAQRVGMFKNLYETSEEVKRVFDVASDVCNLDITKIIFEGPEEDLNRTEFTQPCVLACDIAAGEVLRKNGFKYDYVAGFSLGEYAALYMAGCLSLEDVFKVIKIRAKAMQDAVPFGKGGMMAVKTDDFEELEEICADQRDFVCIANYNSLSQVVVAGEMQGIDTVEKILKEKMIRCQKLKVSAPFHCKLMEPAVKKLETIFEEVNFMSPMVPIIMNYDGKAESDIEKIKEKVLLQTKSPVRWVDTIKNLDEYGTELFIECGPGNTLTKLIRNILPETEAMFVNNLVTLEKVLNLKGSI